MVTRLLAQFAGNRKRAIVLVEFHSLRHSFVSLSAKSGTSASIIQKAVGHGSPAMTDIYMHIDEEQKRLAASLFPNILGPLAEKLSDEPHSASGQIEPEKIVKIGVYDAENRDNPSGPAAAG